MTEEYTYDFFRLPVTRKKPDYSVKFDESGNLVIRKYAYQAYKGQKKKYKVPEIFLKNIGLTKKELEELDQTFYNKCVYLCSYLHYRHSVSERGFQWFINIPSSTLTTLIGSDYNEVIKFLCDKNIVTRNHSYSSDASMTKNKESYCKSIMLNSFRYSNYVDVVVTKNIRNLRDPFAEPKETPEKAIKPNEWNKELENRFFTVELAKFKVEAQQMWVSRLGVDYDSAVEASKQHRDEKLANKKLDRDHRTQAELDYNNTVSMLMSINMKDSPRVTVDSAGRVYSVVTNMPSYLRKFLTIDGCKTIIVDASSSQPAIIAGYMRKLVTMPVDQARKMFMTDFLSAISSLRKNETRVIINKHEKMTLNEKMNGARNYIIDSENLVIEYMKERPELYPDINFSKLSFGQRKILTSFDSTPIKKDIEDGSGIKLKYLDEERKALRRIRSVNTKVFDSKFSLICSARSITRRVMKCLTSQAGREQLEQFCQDLSDGLIYEKIAADHSPETLEYVKNNRKHYKSLVLTVLYCRNTTTRRLTNLIERVNAGTGKVPSGQNYHAYNITNTMYKKYGAVMKAIYYIKSISHGTCAKLIQAIEANLFNGWEGFNQWGVSIHDGILVKASDGLAVKDGFQKILEDNRIPTNCKIDLLGHDASCLTEHLTTLDPLTEKMMVQGIDKTKHVSEGTFRYNLAPWMIDLDDSGSDVKSESIETGKVQDIPVDVRKSDSDHITKMSVSQCISLSIDSWMMYGWSTSEQSRKSNSRDWGGGNSLRFVSVSRAAYSINTYPSYVPGIGDGSWTFASPADNDAPTLDSS